MANPQHTHDDYTIGWISPLEVEQIAAIAMLDERHPRLPQPTTDSNCYTLGSIQGHNVVIAGLPTEGNNAAATVVAYMRSTFPRVKFGLLVGIGGGVPTRTDAGPIKLGHVVVSKPTDQHSGAIQYDHGKAEAGQFQRTGILTRPPHVLLNAARQLAVLNANADEDPLHTHLQRINTSKRGLRRYRHPGPNQDHLYQADCVHADKRLSCQDCGCDAGKRVVRDYDDDLEEDADWVTVHRGTIASGELVMRNGELRDSLAKQHNVLCFEMEAAGALNDFPCLVIRGISDYSDSHKNDRWQGYAAATAAAYARELFSYMPVEEVAQCKIAESDIKQLIEDHRDIHRSSQEASIKNWLDPPNPSINYNQAGRLRHTGTGSWLLDSEVYAGWKSKAKSTRNVWLHGIPGCGKTILSSIVIHDVQHCPLTQPAVILYFFFDFKDSSKRTLDKMLRSLIFQLYHQREDSRKHIVDLMCSCRNGAEQPQTDALVKVLRNMLNVTTEVYIVIDALDECSSRPELLSWLEIASNQDSNILLTSRNEHDIAASLAEWIPTENRVFMEKLSVNEDIRSVVRETIMHDRDLSRWKEDAETRAVIENKLMEKAEGMFRWAVCQLDALKKCLDRKSLMVALNTLPEGLNETYARILRGIPPEYKLNTIRLLRFLTLSKRPLLVEEAVDILAVDLENDVCFDPCYRMPVPSEIARYCGSLASITSRVIMNEWGSEEENMSEEESILEIQLAHLSVREYLLSSHANEAAQADLSGSQAHGCIVQVSLAYLYEASQTRSEKSQMTQLPLKQFAAQYWMDYAPMAETEGYFVLQWIQKLFALDSFFNCWLDTYDPDFPRFPGYPPRHKRPGPLYYVSMGGLARTTEELLLRGANANATARGGRYFSALGAASARGHKKVVRLLLDAGADINAQGGLYGSALQAASVHGHEEVVRMLLDAGADVNAQGGDYGSTLQAASAYGYEEVVRMLLDAGADPNAQARHGSALYMASYGGYEKMVRILLDAGADINAQGDYGSALQAASASGHEEVVRILLDAGADPNTQGEYGSALYRASLYGHEKVVRMLLDAGADPNTQGEYGSALCIASTGGYEKVVRILLDAGADPNTQGEFGTALETAAEGSHEEVVRILLDAGADVNAQGGLYGSALQAALEGGYEKVVRILLDAGADPNAHVRYSSALYMASYGGYEKMVRILLDAGAEVNAQVGLYGSALQAASEHGHEKVVRILLDAGADASVLQAA